MNIEYVNEFNPIGSDFDTIVAPSALKHDKKALDKDPLIQLKEKMKVDKDSAELLKQLDIITRKSNPIDISNSVTDFENTAEKLRERNNSAIKSYNDFVRERTADPSVFLKRQLRIKANSVFSDVEKQYEKSNDELDKTFNISIKEMDKLIDLRRDTISAAAKILLKWSGKDAVLNSLIASVCDKSNSELSSYKATQIGNLMTYYDAAVITNGEIHFESMEKINVLRERNRLITREGFTLVSRSPSQENMPIAENASTAKFTPVTKEIVENPPSIRKEVAAIKAESKDVITATPTITVMDYFAIKNKDSEQYKLRQKASREGRLMCDNNGFYNIKVDGEYRYCVAVGTGWGKKIGDKITIEIKGIKYRAIVADIKDDAHTNKETKEYNGIKWAPHTIHTGGIEKWGAAKGQYFAADNSTIEFVVKTKVVFKGSKGKNKEAYSDGNIYQFFPDKEEKINDFHQGLYTTKKLSK